MANDITKSPWILDTIGDIVNTPGLDAEMRITHIKWVGATTPGHQCVLQEYPDGTTARNFWESVCPGTYLDMDIDFMNQGLLITGLKLAVLGSGKVYIYFTGL